MDIIGTVSRLLKIGNAGMGSVGVLAIAGPFLMQRDQVLIIGYPTIGVALVFFALWAEAARRSPHA